MADPIVQPMADPGASAPAAAAPPTVQDTQGAPAPEDQAPPSDLPKIPDELLHMPMMNALMAGNPGAVSAKIKEFAKKPEAKIIMENRDILTRAGIGLYQSLDKTLGVIFNHLYVNPQELINADRAGKLQVVAPPFDAVTEAIKKSGMTNPVLRHKAIPAGPKSAPAPSVPQTGGVPAPQAAPVAGPGPSPLPASSVGKFQNARLKAMSPGGPTSGPMPGAGRIQNAILKPVV